MRMPIMKGRRKGSLLTGDKTNSIIGTVVGAGATGRKSPAFGVKGLATRGNKRLTTLIRLMFNVR